MFDGGLLLLSRYPIVSEHRIRYQDCKGEDCFSNKGALHARIHPPDYPTPFDVFLTHTQNPTPEVPVPDVGTGSSGYEKVKGQLSQLASFIHRHGDTSRPALLMGDLNTDALDPEAYGEMLSTLHRPEDLWAKNGDSGRSGLEQGAIGFNSQAGITVDRQNTFARGEVRGPGDVSRHQEGERIDYLLYYGGGTYSATFRKTRIVALQSSPGRDISDHYGLMTVLTKLRPLS
jgi:endonuclease/exonuclease/phosphatase family metal-dependent hydrolase